jgi:glycosyltransferase involved in cell wall biosynthesis
MSEYTLLSIVVTAYSAERLNSIYELLESIRDQTYPRIETIFVVERSHALFEKLKDYKAKNKITELKILFCLDENGLSAKNRGIKEAEGEIIAFVHDDIVLYHDWADHMVVAYTDDSIIGVTGAVLPLWENDSVSWFPEEFYWIIGCTTVDRPGEVKNAQDINMSFRREAFAQVGLFHRESSLQIGPTADEDEFSLRARTETGRRIVYRPGARVLRRIHKSVLSTRFIKDRAYRNGYSRQAAKKTVGGYMTNKSDVVDQEYLNVSHIFMHLLPSIMAGFFDGPGESWRKLRVTILILFYFALGYYYLYGHPPKNNGPSGS